MPAVTVWECSDAPNNKAICEVGFSTKSWVKPDKVAAIQGALVGAMEFLTTKIPSGKISVDIDRKKIIITDVDRGDVEKVKKKVVGRQGIKTVKGKRGKAVQTAISLEERFTCHQEFSKDGKPLSVLSPNDPSPYDHLPNLRPTIIVVHTEKLIEEWTSKLENFLGIPREEIGQLGGGRKDHCFVSLSTIQTLSKKEVNDAVKGKINLLISDEVHHSSAGEWKKAVCDLNVLETEEYYLRDGSGQMTNKTVKLPSKLLPVKDRPKTLGLSATPTPFGLERTQILHDCIGPSLINIKDSDIIKQGYILPVKMVRESIAPEESTKFITDFARLLSADFTAEISEKMTSAKQDHRRKYDLNKYEKAFQSAIGGSQFTASAYDENKIKRAISRIAETTDENFLVYSPRVIPLYGVTSLLRSLGIDPQVVPFIGKGSQNIKQYKGVKTQIIQLFEEIEKKDEQIEQKKEEIASKGWESASDKAFVDSLKAQAHFLKELARVGIEASARATMDMNTDWITTDPKNKLQMPLTDFYKVRRTANLEKADLRPPAVVPQPVFIFTLWLPRREFKPLEFAKYAAEKNNSGNPWEGSAGGFNRAVASSIGRWKLLKMLNGFITETKNLKVASSVIAHNIGKEEFNDIKIRENFGNGTTRVLPLSTAGQEGVDIPNANNLIVMSIFTKPKDPIQLTGRIKRVADGKKPGEALFLNIKGTSDDIYFRSLMKGLLIDVFETEHGETFRADLKKEVARKRHGVLAK